MLMHFKNIWIILDMEGQDFSVTQNMCEAIAFYSISCETETRDEQCFIVLLNYRSTQGSDEDGGKNVYMHSLEMCVSKQ